MKITEKNILDLEKKKYIIISALKGMEILHLMLFFHQTGCYFCSVRCYIITCYYNLKAIIDLVKMHLYFTTKNLLIFSDIYLASHYKKIAMLYESFTSPKW